MVDYGARSSGARCDGASHRAVVVLESIAAVPSHLLVLKQRLLRYVDRAASGADMRDDDGVFPDMYSEIRCLHKDLATVLAAVDPRETQARKSK